MEVEPCVLGNVIHYHNISNASTAIEGRVSFMVLYSYSLTLETNRFCGVTGCCVAKH